MRPTTSIANALYADEPELRLHAARKSTDRQRRAFGKRAGTWPPDSPGVLNAWLVLVTTKPPTWRDPYVQWRDAPLTLGEPHEGFFYPDPLGFWSEVRHWATTIIGLATPDALSLTSLLHGAEFMTRALTLMQPEVVLFLDEPAWQSVDLRAIATGHHIPDPYRRGKVYEGWWGRTGDGLIVGKSPQHPAAHKLYARADMDRFLSWPSREDRT